LEFVRVIPGKNCSSPTPAAVSRPCLAYWPTPSWTTGTAGNPDSDLVCQRFDGCSKPRLALGHGVLAPLIDIAGQRFGRLTVAGRAGTGATGEAKWLCRCDCGNRTIARGYSLRNCETTSCGCYGRLTGAMNAKHGHARHYKQSPEYRAWASMLARCYRPTHDAFRWYGGVGITVCKRWRNIRLFRWYGSETSSRFYPPSRTRRGLDGVGADNRGCARNAAHQVPAD
jgi:hypothetical protein